MARSGTAAPLMRVDDLQGLLHDLKAYRSDWEEPATRAWLVEGAIPRLLATLEMLPEGGRESRLLELGSAPFFTSLCLDRMWPGQVTRANYDGTDAKRGSQQLLNVEGGADRVYEYDLFNVETDEFPYADETFDVVLFSELIEHLALNPVWALSEIHRVLKKDGHVVITTPNALSLERLASYLTGGSEMVDKYMPLRGYGTRHNREYKPAEMRELLESTGFDIDALVIRDLGAFPWYQRVRRAVAKVILRFWSRQPRDTHIFVRARRRDPFRWHFPDKLYDDMSMYALLRHPWVEMGVNDEIQCGPGWDALEDWREWGGYIRRARGKLLQALRMPAAVYLRGKDGARHAVARVRVTAEPARPTVGLRLRVVPFHGDQRLGERAVEVQPAEGQEVSVELSRTVGSRDELELQLEIEPDVEAVLKRAWLD